jgi:hypothetical protein
MKLRPIVQLSLVGSLVYLLGFCVLEVLPCLWSVGGCTVHGDVAALIFVLGGSLLLLALLFAVYFWIARRFVDTAMRSVGRFQIQAALGVSSLLYSFVVALVAFYLLADWSQLFSAGFVWDLAAGSALLAAYVSAFGTRPVQ